MTRQPAQYQTRQINVIEVLDKNVFDNIIVKSRITTYIDEKTCSSQNIISSGDFPCSEFGDAAPATHDSR
jgi:hypothetical protein